MQGYITANNETALNIDNAGLFSVRKQDNGGKHVAISNFNDGTINNTGSIELMAVNGVANNDTTGEYTPTGALSSGEEGIQHGQLLGVKDFNHSGVLDIRGSGLSGNVFVITGDKTTAGNNGNGNFTTSGGVLKVATTLNEGGANSRSDMLVADNIIKGTDSTKVAISIAQASTGGKTVDDGIQIIKTLGTQDKTAFTLAGPVTFGEYEYLLFGENAHGDADGFYLRNFLKDTDTKVYLPNPNIGGYLGNQYAAANMFNQNILDRRDNARAPDETVWARVQYNHMNTEQLKGTQKLKVDTSLVQVGADLYRDEQEGKVAGVFFGYGDSDVKNRSKLTGSEVKGSVKGIQLGGYYSWMPQDDNKGAFVDIWGHYAHFSNELSGAAQANSSKKYKGNGLALSIEGGYGFEVGRTEYNTWILEPHAQATYNYLKMDDFTDKNETRFKNNKSNGFTTRVGARFYGYKENQVGVLPFVELNWLHNGVDNGVYVNNTRKDSKIGRNVGELKLGAKGNITEHSSISAHIGVQQGSDKFRNSLGQLVFNYNF
ncbi:autotransporter outer membrane beta-barrel domain-containing protein [Pseudomonas sp. F1_0610]|uniref:autotransporter family protein n=1 Tax=Pseudomonas sp. F1_0610 TaxID=3114284 RepID=UPI0039C315AA